MTNINNNSLSNICSEVSLSLPSQIVFIDSGVTDYSTLANGVIPAIKVVILNSNQDGIKQISQVLSQKPYSTVHIVSHGSPGCLYLGNSQLSLATLAQYKSQLKIWFSPSPSPLVPQSPNLLLYGCNLAVGDAGAEFISKLNALTGAEIAASTTPIGNANLGGNWELDVAPQKVENLAFTKATQKNYLGIFPEDYGDAPDDGFSGNGAEDYTTLLSTGGASHTIDTNLTLGLTIDADDGTLQNADADDDDTTGNASTDEDGVTFTEGSIISSNDVDRTFSVNVVVNNSQTATSTISDDFQTDDFAGGTGWTADWSASGQWVDVRDDQWNNPSNYILQTGWSSTGIFLPNASRTFNAGDASGDATLTFDYAKGSLDSTDGFEIQISDGQGNVTTVFSLPDATVIPSDIWSGGNPYLSANVTIPESFLTSSSRLSIVTLGDFSGDDGGSPGAFYFDNFDITYPSVKDTKLVGWIDFDRSGTFDADEAATLDTNSGLVTDGATANTLNWSGFTDDITEDGNIAGRFRVSTDENLDESYSTGNLTDGEVEDYLLTVATVRDYGDAPDSLGGAVTAATNPNQDLPDYLTTETEGGASHTLKEDCPIVIGTDVDPDNGSLQNDTATVDDTTNTGSSNDESGVFVGGTSTSLDNTDININASTYSVDVTVNQPSLPATGVSSTVTGTVYNDYDSDGNFDGTQTITHDEGGVTRTTEGGLAGITVTAYRNDGTQVGTTTTNANGEYSLSNPTGEALRIEFSNLPTGYNNTSDSSIFVDGSGNPTVNLGMLQDNHYVDSNSVPKLLTTCFVFGGYDQNTEAALISVLHTDQGQTPANKTVEVTYEKVGTVYGLAHSKQTQDIFLGAFQKRNTDVGSGGNDAIYRVDDSGNVTTLVELDTYFGTTDTAGAYAHGTIANNRTESDRPTDISVDNTEWIRDEAAFSQVTKVGFGDVEITGDGEYLWTINLANRELYKIEIGDGSTYVAQGSESRTIASFDIVNNLTGLEQGSRTNAGDVIQDLRPFALAERNGVMYVGLVDSAQATQNASDLHAYVYSFDPTAVTPTFTKELDFALDYARDSRHSSVNGTSEWQPWIDNFADLTFAGDGEGLWVNETQPILSDIEFDNNGDIILGFRDRSTDQVSPGTSDLDGVFPSNPSGNDTYQSASGGDILRGTWDGSSWTIESGATDADINTEFYGGEEFRSHMETAQGGLVQIPGYDSVETTALDPFTFATGGIIGLNNSDGGQTRGIEIFAEEPFIDKANGLGDLEYAGEVAPIEIGNRLWVDLDRDGLQDAGEPSIAGTTVSLHNSDGSSLLATTTTDEYGEYYFNSSNVTGGLLPTTTYQIRLDNATDFATNGALDNLTLTDPNANSNADDDIDSDAEDVSGTPTITVTTGNYGENDYTNDFGFIKDVTLVGWIDFDRDGIFEDTEAVVLDTSDPVNGLKTDGTANTLSFPVPNDVEAGSTAARFRVASGLAGENINGVFGDNTPNGAAPDGEVEDYIVNLVETVSIGSTIFEDINNNGTQGSGEAGIPGVTVELYDPGADGEVGGGDDVFLESTTTDGSGDYIFEGLAEGNYYISIPASNFTGGGDLENSPLSSTTTETTDNQVDGDDNGIQASSGAVTNSPVINLTVGNEPTDGDGSGTNDEFEQGNTQDNSTNDANGDMTVDFGFVSKNIIDGDGSPNEISGTSGDDLVTGGKGEDTLTGGIGNDCFYFNETSDGIDTITDFTVGEDKIDLSAILADEVTAYTSGDLFTQGYVELAEINLGGTTSTIVQIDFDAGDETLSSDLYHKDIALLEGVALNTLDTSRDFII